MILSETHIIDSNHTFFKEIDNLSFLAKNLYNKANYIIRQKFIETTKLKDLNLVEHATYLNYYSINRILIDNNDYDYYMLPTRVANQVLMDLDKNWKSFFKTIKDWGKNKHKYKGKPNLPKYKHKVKGRYCVKYELGAISKTMLLKEGKIKLSKTNIVIPFINHKRGILKQVSITTSNTNVYKINIIYEVEINDLNLSKENIISIDLGVNNLMTLTSNVFGFRPTIVNGRILKSINQFYNKVIGEINNELSEIKHFTSKRSKKVTHNREMKINDYFHKSSKFVIDLCIKHNIGKIVIGKNEGWKQEVNIGKKNNQNFVGIPYNKLISKIKYKGELVGIEVKEMDESYTSKASFIDLDVVPTYSKNNNIKYNFSGKRFSRGLYRSKNNIIINSDVNGSYNILRKELFEMGKEFTHDDIVVLAVIPVRVKSTNDFHRNL